MRVILIDNNDSFTYNLKHCIEQFTNEVLVCRGSEINLELTLMMLDILSKLSDNEKLTEDELNKIQDSKNILSDFIDKRSIKNNKDLEYLKKLMDK